MVPRFFQSFGLALALGTGIAHAQTHDVEAGSLDPAEVVLIPPRAKVTISKETTRIVEPLLPDGTLDYATALNRKNSAGLTPDKNAAVLLLRIIGPDMLPEKREQEAIKLLGLPPDWDQSGHFVDVFPTSKPGVINSGHVSSRKATLEEQKFRYRYRFYPSYPWNREDWPKMASKLTQNQAILDRLRTIKDCTGFYFPVLPSNYGMRTTTGHYNPYIEQLLTVLQIRAMQSLGAGDFAGYKADLLAVLQTCCFLHNSPALWDQYCNNYKEIGVYFAIRLAAIHDCLPEQECLQWLQTLTELPPPPNLAQHNRDSFERYDMLNRVVWDNSHKDLCHYTITDKSVPNPYAYVENTDVDWNAELLNANQRYDELLEAWDTEDWGKILVENLRYAQLGKRQKEWRNDPRARRTDDASVREFAHDVVNGNMVLSFNRSIASNVRNKFHLRTELELTKITLRLAIYQKQHGTYPETLQELDRQPDLPKIANDPFSGMPMHYKLTKQGFVLYSVGPNGVDEGGQHDMSLPWNNDTMMSSGKDDLKVDSAETLPEFKLDPDAITIEYGPSEFVESDL